MIRRHNGRLRLGCPPRPVLERVWFYEAFRASRVIVLFCAIFSPNPFVEFSELIDQPHPDNRVAVDSLFAVHNPF